MTRIELRPHGPTSFTVSIDGKPQRAFWYVEELGEGRYHLSPVFPVGGHKPFELAGELVRLPRQACYVTWREGQLHEEVVDLEDEAQNNPQAER